jgi:acyl carrier protein
MMFTLDEFREAVKAGIKIVLKKKDDVVLGDDEDFEDYGLDSLAGISLVLEVEKYLNIDLGEYDQSFLQENQENAGGIRFVNLFKRAAGR